jgi:UDP:flavonoid glycosyltransferase YjiC (YdhE family)
MRVLCLSAPLSGHLDWGGYLQTACALQHRGHELLWASGAAVAPQVEAVGLRFHPLRETGWRWPPPPPLRADAASDRQSLLRLRQLRSLDQWLDVARVGAAVAEIGELASRFQPDIILSEMFIAAAGIVAEQVDAPLVVAGWPAPARDAPTVSPITDPLLATGRARLDKLRVRFSVQGRNWTISGPPALCSPDLHLSYWSATWFGNAPLGRQTLHVGGSAGASQPWPGTLPDPALAPWVFITLGTTFNQDPNFFLNASHAAAQLGATPIIALGGNENERLADALAGRLPVQSHVVETVTFGEVLPHCLAALHHGGAGTTHALVTYGVPQIVVPHAADQTRQGQGVARTGCGYHMSPRQASVDNLRNALAQLLPDHSPQRARAVALQAEFAKLGGVEVAATAVEAVAMPPLRSA